MISTTTKITDLGIDELIEDAKLTLNTRPDWIVPGSDRPLNPDEFDQEFYSTAEWMLSVAPL